MTTLADQQRATEQFDALCARLHITPDSGGECWMDCPSCGKDGKHFSFSERGFKCFSCGYAGRSLKTVADAFNLPVGEARQNVTRRAVRASAVRKPLDLAGYLQRSCEALDRLSYWSAYKPLALDTIARFRLGVGRLPMWSEKHSRAYGWPHRRLIVPVFDAAGTVVALHGRRISSEDTGAKWLSASGSDLTTLMVVGDLRPGCTVIVTENRVDAMLAYQADPSVCYLPIGGVSMWREEWTARIAAARPTSVLIWLDHDLAGNGSRYHHREMLAKWRAEIEARRAANPRLQATPFPRDPEPAGPKIANDLLRAGVRARVYEWPKGTPHKADLAWYLEQST